MSNDYIKVQRRPLMDYLTCPLCSNVYREATTICVCLHTFCKQCIYHKLEKENRNQCPVCNAYLGTFPAETLRNDHNLRRLVIQIFPLEKTKEGKRISNEQDVLGNDLRLSQTENKSSNHSMKDDTKKQNKIIDLELPNVISEPTDDRAFSLERSKGCSCWERLAGDHKEGETYNTDFNVQVKRRRRTKRKPSKFLTTQREDSPKIGTETEISKVDPSGLGKSTDSSSQCGETIPEHHPKYPRHPVWFCLLACQEKESLALPQILKPFISTKNGDLEVSFLNKYLAKKLNLKHESEVEVMCFGHPLVPTLTLNNLIEIWLEALPDIGPVSVNVEKGDGRKFLMELTYRRSNNHCTLL